MTNRNFPVENMDNALFRNFCEEINFNHWGYITLAEPNNSLGFEYINEIDKKIAEGWLYCWVAFSPEEHTYNIRYIGYAGKTLSRRGKQHQAGFNRVLTEDDDKPAPGKRNAKDIKTWLMEGNGFHLYARHSERKEIFGVDVSLCQAEEKALIQLCMSQRIKLWNGRRSPRKKA